MMITRLISDDFSEEIRNAYNGDREIRKLQEDVKTNPRITKDYHGTILWDQLLFILIKKRENIV